VLKGAEKKRETRPKKTRPPDYKSNPNKDAREQKQEKGESSVCRGQVGSKGRVLEAGRSQCTNKRGGKKAKERDYRTVQWGTENQGREHTPLGAASLRARD